MTQVNPPYEKRVSLDIIDCSEELKKYATMIADELPGLIDLHFGHASVEFHYNNNGLNIDALAEFLQKIDIEIEDSLLNKIKLCFHCFVDANAKANAISKPSCSAAVDEICKTCVANKASEKVH